MTKQRRNYIRALLLALLCALLFSLLPFARRNVAYGSTFTINPLTKITSTYSEGVKLKSSGVSDNRLNQAAAYIDDIEIYAAIDYHSSIIDIGIELTPGADGNIANYDFQQTDSDLGTGRVVVRIWKNDVLLGDVLPDIEEWDDEDVSTSFHGCVTDDGGRSSIKVRTEDDEYAGVNWYYTSYSAYFMPGDTIKIQAIVLFNIEWQDWGARWIDYYAAATTSVRNLGADITYNASYVYAGDNVKTQDGVTYTNGDVTFTYTVGREAVGDGQGALFFQPNVEATVNTKKITSKKWVVQDEGAYEFILYSLYSQSPYRERAHSRSVVIDKSAPVLKATDGLGVELTSGANFATDVTFTATDVSPLTVTVNGEAIEHENGVFVISPADYTTDVYIKVTDVLGFEAEFELKRYVETDFNKTAIETSYKATRWYNVKLPTARYTMISRHDYSFLTYDSAFAFAITMENAYKVQTTANGWVYSTADDMSNSQEYTDRATMDIVIKKWAATFVSEAQSYKPTGNKYYADDNGRELSSNALSVPSSVSTISTAYYIRADYVFFKDEYRTSQEITQTASARYLGDVVNGTHVDYGLNISITSLPIGTLSWGAALTSANANKQGFWEITEADDIGNTTTYVVYYDLTAPSVKLTGERGDGSSREMEIKENGYVGATQFTKLTIGDVADNMDEADNLMIKLYGRNAANVVYTSFDELPELSYENGYHGEYVITVYDRSNNERTFTFVIAPETLPFWTYSSLFNQTRLRITFATGYSLNSIVDIKMYRVSSTGARTLIDKDDEGTTIDQLTLEYVFTVGGKYQAELTDIFGRTVITEPIFYQKGLPEGTLKGVKEGETTNKTVTFTCLNNLITRLYVIEGDVKTEAKSEWYTTTVEGENRILTILPSEATSHSYLLSLHSAVNEELFIEYRFAIDTICADVLIKDTTGKELDYDGWTTKGFVITSKETGTRLFYYVNEYSGLGLKRYVDGTTITADGIYYFTIQDEIGNEREFRIHVDTVVNMDIVGAYTVKDGKYVARSSLKFTCLETHTTFMLTKGGATFENGATLTEDGEYTLYVADSYGNVFDIAILIDQVAPTVQLYGVKDGGITRENVAISFEDGANGVLTNAKGVKIKDIASGDLFTEDGSYFVLVTDYAGNESRVTFYIQTKIEITANILNEQITSDPVSVAFASDVTIAITRDGADIDYQTRFVDVGVYEIKAVDEIGNELVFRFKIIEKLYREYEVELDDGWEIASVKKNGEPIETTSRLVETGDYVMTITDGTVYYDLILQIDCTPPTVEIEIGGNKATFSGANKDNVTAKLYKGDEEVVGYTFGQAIKENGSYRLELTDELGNTNVYEFDVPFQLNGWAIAVIVISAVVLLLVIIFIIKSRQIKI